MAQAESEQSIGGPARSLCWYNIKQYWWTGLESQSGCGERWTDLGNILGANINIV